MSPSFTRALAVDPTSKGFAWAVLEGSERLVGWGTSRLRKDSKTSFEERIEGLLDRYVPSLIVVEEASLARHGLRASTRRGKLIATVVSQGLEIATVSRAQVRRMFSASGTSRFEIALAISLWFPEVAPHLPKKRRIFDPEDERLDMFDALSLALTELRSREWGQPAA